MQSRQLERTKTPGIYKRGSRYVVIYRDPDGQQRKRAAETLAQARDLKASLATDISRGEYVPQTKLTVQEYFNGWIGSYAGRTRKGIRANTITGYKDQMRVHVLPALGRRRLAEIGPRDIKQLAADLNAKGLSANSVRLAIAPLRAMLATAFEDELIRRNPAANVRIAQPTNGDESEPAKAKALTGEGLSRLVAAIPEQHRLLVELLARTGLRIGEAAALTWADVDFGRKRIKVRRRWYRGSFAPPKSGYGKRDVPISTTLAQQLWAIRGRDEQLIFGTRKGTPLNAANFYTRVFMPAAVTAGLATITVADDGSRHYEGPTFHTLRHTCATMLFRAGKNPKQVQGWLGHHSASFTLDTYVHLLADDIGDAPDIFDVPLTGATGGQQDEPKPAETADTVEPLVSLSEAVSA